MRRNGVQTTHPVNIATRPPAGDKHHHRETQIKQSALRMLIVCPDPRVPPKRANVADRDGRLKRRCLDADARPLLVRNSAIDRCLELSRPELESAFRIDRRFLN